MNTESENPKGNFERDMTILLACLQNTDGEPRWDLPTHRLPSLLEEPKETSKNKQLWQEVALIFYHVQNNFMLFSPHLNFANVAFPKTY